MSALNSSFGFLRVVLRNKYGSVLPAPDEAATSATQESKEKGPAPHGAAESCHATSHISCDKGEEKSTGDEQRDILLRTTEVQQQQPQQQNLERVCCVYWSQLRGISFFLSFFKKKFNVG